MDPTVTRSLALCVEQQTGVAQFRLDVQPTALLPGGDQVEDVRVRADSLVVPSLPHLALPVTVAPVAIERAFDSIQAAILVILNLGKKRW